MKIYPKDWVEPAKTGPLEMSAAKKTAMVKKAKELVTEPIEDKDLMDKLEQYYIFEKGEHYTSAQLKEVIDKVAEDLYVAPEEDNQI